GRIQCPATGSSSYNQPVLNSIRLPLLEINNHCSAL
ncbi:MAG: hypothetical protein ACI9HK_002307, partial [Pirellulaceae bacterium]